MRGQKILRPVLFLGVKIHKLPRIYALNNLTFQGPKVVR